MSIKLETWKSLYYSARILDGILVWYRINKFNIFAIDDPSSEELGFCNFAGIGNDYHFFLVHQGLEGLKNFSDFICFEGKYLNHALYRQKGLQVAFVNRSALGKSDLNIITMLSLQFKGKSAWFVFLLEIEIFFEPEIPVLDSIFSQMMDFHNKEPKEKEIK